MPGENPGILPLFFVSINSVGDCNSTCNRPAIHLHSNGCLFLFFYGYMNFRRSFFGGGEVDSATVTPLWYLSMSSDSLPKLGHEWTFLAFRRPIGSERDKQMEINIDNELRDWKRCQVSRVPWLSFFYLTPPPPVLRKRWIKYLPMIVVMFQTTAALLKKCFTFFRFLLGCPAGT